MIGAASASTHPLNSSLNLKIQMEKNFGGRTSLHVEPENKVLVKKVDTQTEAQSSEVSRKCSEQEIEVSQEHQGGTELEGNNERKIEFDENHQEGTELEGNNGQEIELDGNYQEGTELEGNNVQEIELAENCQEGTELEGDYVQEIELAENHQDGTELEGNSGREIELSENHQGETSLRNERYDSGSGLTVNDNSTVTFTIFPVPKKVRKLKEEAYDPRVISIGPYHYGDERYKPMEATKRIFCKRLEQRRSSFTEYLKSKETDVRQCYSELSNLNSEQFTEMLFIDCCFIIQLIITHIPEFQNDKEFQKEKEFFELSARRLLHDICHDLILLENQIPFFVLEELYIRAMNNKFEQMDFLKLALRYFKHYNHNDISYDMIERPIMHFTHLISIFYKPADRQESHVSFDTSEENIEESQSTKTATELHEAGVKFKKSQSKCLFDIKFDERKGELEIPRLTVNDETEYLFRNLTIFEFYQSQDVGYMTHYICFMDGLIKTAEDVRLLARSGTLDNGLGNCEAVASLYNNMHRHIYFTREKSYFYNLSKKLDKYCKVPSHKWRATLKRRYFSSPWRTASTVAATMLIVLTFIQTVSSVISLMRELDGGGQSNIMQIPRTTYNSRR